MKKYIHNFLLTGFCFYSQLLFAQPVTTDMHYTVSMENPAAHYFSVVLSYHNIHTKDIDLKICAWTPGDYRIHSYAHDIIDFAVTDASGNKIEWEKPSTNVWRVHNSSATSIVVNYSVRADTAMIVNEFVDENRAIITPAGLFLYADEELKKPVTVEIKPYSKWNDFVATGLDTLPGKKNIFYAPDFDVLFDSPYLLGKLEVLPSFTINGVPHYFVAYDLGAFDRTQFISDLKKVVQNGINIIGDIPYSHYTFLDIGEGPGGIEHANSVTLSFRNKNILATPTVKMRTYRLLAHEFFHLYNVKRIRPLVLGPFDYTKENYTNMLWVSEGITDYYAYLMVKHAGLMNTEELLGNYQNVIRSYENKPGHLYQSATEASHETWNNSPFGKTQGQMDKTISYYDKGCILGLLLDFKIRHETNNKHSLDDVMRKLYTKYYQTLKRGFTDQEFQDESEAIAGASLAEVFEYASTVKAVNYPKYFAYAGLSIDTLIKPAAYLGVSTGIQTNASLVINDIDIQSPAAKAGLHANDKILAIEGNTPSTDLLNNTLKTKKSGEDLRLSIETGGQVKEVIIRLGSKYEKSFAITQIAKPDQLQTLILNSWVN